jgi:N-acetylmuramic acid 6-phosphate etherase
MVTALNLNQMNITEAESLYNDLEKMSIREILEAIHSEDRKVTEAVERALPRIERLVTAIAIRMKKGGRLFYIGAGTSGRLGILDASEIPPTYGVSYDLVTGLIAGGDAAIRKAVESAEDKEDMGWNDLKKHSINRMDSVIGIAASGATPYVVGAVKRCRAEGILTGCITCNTDSLLAGLVEYPVEVPVGPEFVTGSTRMKAGTAQKMILNMISTTLMIQLGRVKGNKMVNMQLTNKKLINRGTKMIVEELGIETERARNLLLLHGSVKKVLDLLKE